MRSVATALVLALVWVLWSGHFEPLVVGFGVVSILLTIFAAKRLNVLDGEGQPMGVFLVRVPVFIAWLVGEIISANIQVARIILNPRLPIRSHLIRVPANQKTDLGRTIHANTITITPGTVALDVRDDVILVHALDDSLASQEDEGACDRKISWLEGSL